MFDWNQFHGLCPLNSQQGPCFQPSKSPEMKTQRGGQFAGTISRLLLAGEEGLSSVTVTRVTLYQTPHLETVMTLQSSFLLLHLLIYWFGMISSGPQCKS